MVIPVRNGLATLPACLEAVLGQSLRPWAVYVVDNGSADGTYEWLQSFATRHPAVRPLREERRGPAAARNAGVRRAVAEGGVGWVAFTDADCVPEPDWLEKLCRSFDRDRIGAVTGRIRACAADTLVGRYLAVTAFDPGARDRLATCVAFGEGTAGGNSAVRVAALQDAGMFDESFRVAQDWELGLRLLKAGWWIRYTREAVVRHLHPERSVGDLARLAAKYGRGRPAIVARHFRNRVFLSAFGRTLTARAPWTAHIQLTSPEKVVLGLCAAGLRWPWAWWLLPAYAVYLAVRIRRAARTRGDVRVRTGELPGMVALQLLESVVSNGRALGESLLVGTLCV